MNLISFKAKKNDEGRILFKFLVRVLNNVPISKVEKVFRHKDVKVNGKRNFAKTYSIKENDLIQVYGIKNFSKDYVNNSIVDFKIIFEDENIIIINKDIDVVVHGESNALDRKVLKYLNYKPISSFIPSHIGRLDKVTSGIIVYAKTYLALKELKAKQEHFTKTYIFDAPLDNIKYQDKIVSIKIAKDIKRMKMHVNPNGIRAITRFYFDKRWHAELITGRKHQIRATLQYLHASIKGDKKYGGDLAYRVFLHSFKINFKGLEKLAYLNGQEFKTDIPWKGKQWKK